MYNWDELIDHSGSTSSLTVGSKYFPELRERPWRWRRGDEDSIVEMKTLDPVTCRMVELRTWPLQEAPSHLKWNTLRRFSWQHWDGFRGGDICLTSHYCIIGNSGDKRNRSWLGDR